MGARGSCNFDNKIDDFILFYIRKSLAFQRWWKQLLMRYFQFFFFALILSCFLTLYTLGCIPTPARDVRFISCSVRKKFDCNMILLGFQDSRKFGSYLAAMILLLLNLRMKHNLALPRVLCKGSRSLQRMPWKLHLPKNEISWYSMQVLLHTRIPALEAALHHAASQYYLSFLHCCLA